MVHLGHCVVCDVADEPECALTANHQVLDDGDGVIRGEVHQGVQAVPNLQCTAIKAVMKPCLILSLALSLHPSLFLKQQAGPTHTKAEQAMTCTAVCKHCVLRITQTGASIRQLLAEEYFLYVDGVQVRGSMRRTSLKDAPADLFESKAVHSVNYVPSIPSHECT